MHCGAACHVLGARIGEGRHPRIAAHGSATRHYRIVNPDKSLPLDIIFAGGDYSGP
jgi:hypothetical protein